MAEEDLIFGKNRHMFGGIEPSNMLTFTTTRDMVNDKVNIIAQLPNDTMINNQLLCTVGGAVIRRKTTGYPIDEFDGDFVAKITESGTIVDSEADADTVYYYAAFPFSTQDVYNRGHKNRTKYDYPKATYYYGFDIDLSDSNPSTRVTYPTDVMNVGFTPAKMNRTTDTFEYGGWPSTAGEKFMPRPCVINKENGLVAQYLDPNDYSKTSTGTASIYYGKSSDASYTYSYAYMVEWPKIYTHREVVNGVYKFRCADIALGDDWDCLCNYDSSGKQIDHFYTGVYKGLGGYNGGKPSLTNSLFRKISNDTPSNWINFIKSNYVSGMTPRLLVDQLLIQDLLILMAKTTDLSTAYSCWQSSSTELENGIFDKKGMFYGNSSATAVKVFGMEHFWSNTNPGLLMGFLVDNGKIKVKLTSSTHDGSSATDYNFTGSGYLEITDLKDYISSSGDYVGYISSTINKSYGRIPIGKDGSATKYECGDFNYYIDTSGAIKVAQVGAGYRPGPFSIQTKTSTTNSISIACITLSYKPRRTS